jgi:acyl carrier protein
MHDYQALLGRLYEILKPFNTEGIDLTEETGLVADLGLDSMHVMQLIVMVEDDFDISIPLNILPEIRTVRDFAEQLQQLLAQGL